MNMHRLLWGDDFANDQMKAWFLVCAGVALLLIWLLPTLIATVRRREYCLRIIALNVLLGWTIVGWIVALAWACSKSNKAASVDQPNASYQIISPSNARASQMVFERPGKLVTQTDCPIGSSVMLDTSGNAVLWLMATGPIIAGLIVIMLFKHAGSVIIVALALAAFVSSTVVVLMAIPGWIEFEEGELRIHEHPVGTSFRARLGGEPECDHLVSYLDSQVYLGLRENVLMRIEVGTGEGQRVAEAIASHIARSNQYRGWEHSNPETCRVEVCLESLFKAEE